MANNDPIMKEGTNIPTISDSPPLHPTKTVPFSNQILVEVRSDTSSIKKVVPDANDVLRNRYTQGDRSSVAFYSVQEAAIAALKVSNRHSISTKKEYAGRICKLKNDSIYIYTLPKQGTKDSSNPGVCPTDTTLAGTYHSHGDYDKTRNTYNKFSNQDIISANKEMVINYMSAPTGEVRVYNPNKKNEYVKIPREANPRDASDAGHILKGVEVPHRLGMPLPDNNPISMHTPASHKHPPNNSRIR